MKKKGKIIIYDLDGTLVDSMPSIAGSYKHTLQQLKAAEPSEEEIRKAIGPGLHKAMEALLGSNDKEFIDKAAKIYRQHHDSEGYKLTKFYPGIKAMVEELKALSAPQFVASMKANTIVKPILKYLDSLSLFTDAIGASPEGLTKTKSEMLRFLAQKYEFALSETILVGDTAHDARAAKEAGVSFYAVTFGYGTKAEMAEYGWENISNSVEELRNSLLEMQWNSPIEDF